MISEFRKMAGRKHANKNETETRVSGQTMASPGPDEFLLKPKLLSHTDFDGT